MVLTGVNYLVDFMIEFKLIPSPQDNDYPGFPSMFPAELAVHAGFFSR
jgi:hypothetical protein